MRVRTCPSGPDTSHPHCVAVFQDVPEAVAYVSEPALHHQQHTQQAPTSQALPARPAFASSSLSVPVSDGYWSTSAGGWVVALSLLIAVRQGRAQADAARLDVRTLQARQHESRVQVSRCRAQTAAGDLRILPLSTQDDYGALGCTALVCQHAVHAGHAVDVCVSDLLLQSRELKEKRAQYLQQQQLLKEEAAAKRCAMLGHLYCKRSFNDTQNLWSLHMHPNTPS